MTLHGWQTSNSCSEVVSSSSWNSFLAFLWFCGSLAPEKDGLDQNIFYMLSWVFYHNWAVKKTRRYGSEQQRSDVSLQRVELYCCVKCLIMLCKCFTNMTCWQSMNQWIMETFHFRNRVQKWWIARVCTWIQTANVFVIQSCSSVKLKLLFLGHFHTVSYSQRFSTSCKPVVLFVISTLALGTVHTAAEWKEVTACGRCGSSWGVSGAKGAEDSDVVRRGGSAETHLTTVVSISLFKKSLAHSVVPKFWIWFKKQVGSVLMSAGTSVAESCRGWVLVS